MNFTAGLSAFAGDVARPFAIIASSASASAATVIVAAAGVDLGQGAILVGAAWGGAAALYGAKAAEVAKIESEKAKAGQFVSGQP
jgi:hypothetical protein